MTIPPKIPVILDTDIGTDIDDTWALGLLLNCPELDVKLITVASGDTVYRAKIVAKFLETAGRIDIPIGIGPAQNDKWGPQAPWVVDYNLDSYPGTIHENGVQALIDTIHTHSNLKIIVIGPMTNIAAALRQDPTIATKSSIIAMSGSVYEGYEGKRKLAAEYNVVQDITACQEVFAAPWPIMITPLDTCGKIILTGDYYRKILDSNAPIPQAIIENYEIWAFRSSRHDVQKESSVLFDTVAIYLAIDETFVEMESVPIKIDNKGVMNVDKKGKITHCAVKWRDIEGFYEWLVNRLI